MQTITEILQLYERDDGATLERLNSPQARTYARQIETLLAERLTAQDVPYVSLWNRFVIDPDAHAEELTGVLEALTEAEPAFATRLEGLLVDYQAASNANRAGSERDISFGESSPQIETTSTEIKNPAAGDPFSEGTYLYGNAGDIRESEGRQIGVRPANPNHRKNLEEVRLDELRFPGLFRRIKQAIREHPELSNQDKSVLQAEVDQLQGLIGHGGRLSQSEKQTMAIQLRTIQKLSPDIFLLLVEGLKSNAVELEGKISRLIENTG